MGCEESISSLTYGIKGQLDGIVSAKLTAGGRIVAEFPLPLELKTGKRTDHSATDHAAQLLVYMLLLGELHGTRVPCGLLLYTQLASTATNGVFVVAADPSHIAALMTQRNRLVGAAAPSAIEDERMPAPIRDARACGWCDRAVQCTLLHRAVEGGDSASFGPADVYAAHTAHLQAHHFEYLKHWLRLVELEERPTLRTARETTALTARERESLGRALAALALVAIVPAARDDTSGRDDQWVHTFRRAGDAQSPLSACTLGPGDLVTISTEESAEETASARWAISRGPIVAIGAEEVLVALDVRLTDLSVPICDQANATPPLRIRLDKSEIASSFTTCRTNLYALMGAQQPSEPQQQQQQSKRPSPGVASRLLELVVDLAPPAFGPRDTAIATLPPPERERLDSLNGGQREAVASVLAAQDYALVLGMPGTGKTTLIAAATRALVARGGTVLLSAYTHNAVDALLLKLLDEGVPFVRLGGGSKVHPRIRPHTLASITRDLATSTNGGTLPAEVVMGRLEEALAARPVIAATALALSHPLLASRRFDAAIVDEAGQMTEPVCIGPLLAARRFVLVGDMYQLPPLVSDSAARRDGMGVSLFARLAEAQPTAVSRLSVQYRMSEPIMRICNALVYGGLLSCGTDSVATAKLELPDRAGLSRMRAHTAAWAAAQAWEVEADAGTDKAGRTPLAPVTAQAQPYQPPPPPAVSRQAVAPPAGSRTAAWLEAALDPERRVLLLDTDEMPAPELRTPAGHVHNPTEAALIVQLLGSLLTSGVPPSSVAIISPYRAQLRHIGGLLPPNAASVELLTIDQCQGRDFEAVLLSLVRSNEQGEAGPLLLDFRRLNVAFSRAKRKLVLVGAPKTLAGSPALSALLKLAAESPGWWTQLPPKADELYAVTPG